MKGPAKIGLLVVASLLVLAALAGTASRKHSAQANLDRTRLALRQQGFKLELAEFNFAVSVQDSARAFALDEAGAACRLPLAEAIDFLPPVGTNAALVMWNQPTLVAESCADLWPGLRAQLDQPMLEHACVAALSGPYRSRVATPLGGIEQVGGNACRLPCPLAARTLLALHEHDQARAWTNLLALTKLVAGWHPLPFEQDVLYWHNVNLVRAFGITWQALQARTLTEPQLATLQRGWESADFRSGLPEVAALARAEIESEYRWQAIRVLPFRFTHMPSPRYGWWRLTEAWHRRRMLQDEEALLQLFRRCEEDYRRVQACSTWREIRTMPGLRTPPPGIANLRPSATNLVPSATNPMNRRSIALSSVYARYRFAFEPLMPGSLWRMADSESKRRLLIAALALERYCLRHGSYPESLDALTPELLPSRPLDFMDGAPLRYRHTQDGRFVLYSTGLDCIDDGGIGRKPGLLWANSGHDHTDLVWPCPASPAEIAAEAASRRRLPQADTTGRTFVPDR
jgi:hypothetical protein